MAKDTSQGKARSAEVESFLEALEHPAKREILALREAILAADSTIVEEIKWKSPSFRTTQHFATVNLRARQGVGLILHFGAKKNEISARGVAIEDPESLLEWLAKDRAMVSFASASDLRAKRQAFTRLIREWIKHV
jgi:hypothetical protein